VPEQSAELVKLPICLERFEQILDGQYFYVDKTEYLYHLVTDPLPYFLSRPRRFGKSLLVSSLENILHGHQDKFRGLWIGSSDYDWKPRPVIRLDMSNAEGNSLDIITFRLSHNVKVAAEIENIIIGDALPDLMLQDLILKLYQ
jgi:hypothetical protein